ncbi:MAG: DUF5131 family protein [Rhodospirillaceae bacterium]
MAENSAIEWCDHTFNAWIGCQEVSPACDFCYAKRQNAHRKWVDGWGPDGERRRTSRALWRQPHKYQRQASTFRKENGRRQRVFVNSLSDVFDNKADPQWRADLFATIEACPDVDFLLLTKRPQNIRAMLPANWENGYPNVWLGVTVENQAEADRRLPHLKAIPAARHFLSIEPLLAPLTLEPEADSSYQMLSKWYGPNGFDPTGSQPRLLRMKGNIWKVDWVIVGGESGPKARPVHPDWIRALRDQCAAGKVPFFFKQWGEWRERAHAGEELGLNLPEDLSTAWPDGTIGNGNSTANGGYGKPLFRFGKKKAGRILDGRTHNEFPESMAA